MPEPLPNDIRKEFVCDTPCVPATTYKLKLGNKFATALTGFVAGVIVATIMLYPWIKFLGDFCPNVPQNGVSAPSMGSTDEGQTVPPAPSPSGTMPAAGEPGAAPPPPGLNLEVQTGPAQ